MTFVPTAAHVMQARQMLAKASLADFASLVDIPTVPISDAADEDHFSVMRLDKLAGHHELLCREIQDVMEGRTPNLMAFMPPGSAKSTYVDVVGVPWFMAQKPRRNVILASYATGIARKQGRRARQLVKSKSFGNLFPGVTLSSDTSAAEEWALSNGSEYMAGGLLSGLTGNRAALGIVDDPVAGREEAESETIRNKTWDAYIDDFCSRLIPGAPQLMILTRWHELDIAGRILPEDWDGESGLIDGRDGRQWKVVRLPAIADRRDDPMGRKIGERLWPEWFTESHFEPFKRNARTWASLYQGKPSPEQGTFFEERWFHRYTERPKFLNYYLTSDHAPGGGEANDFNVYNVWGVDKNQHLWLVEEYRKQCKMAEALGFQLDADGEIVIDPRTELPVLAATGALPMIKRWKPFAWFPENDHTWKANEAFVRSMMRRLKIGCRIEALPTANDKPTKAQPFQNKAILGEVHLPVGPMGDEVLGEYKRFPAGKNDDRIDAAASIARALDMAHPAIVPVKAAPENDPKDRYARARAEQERTGENDWLVW